MRCRRCPRQLPPAPRACAARDILTEGTPPARPGPPPRPARCRDEAYRLPSTKHRACARGGVPVRRRQEVAMTVPAAVLSSARWRRLVPIAFITYSFAYLDRSNYSIGAAGGLTDTLHISSA